jgi:hypothetical protein
LYVVEEGHERAECGRDRVGATMLVQHGKHLKAFTVIKCPLIVKKKTKGALANRIPNLPLPEETSRGIGRSSDENII